VAITDATLEALLDKLETAYYGGALEVVHGNPPKKVRFDSESDLWARILKLRRRLGLSSGSLAHYGRSSKGL